MAKSPKIIVQKATAFQLNPDRSYIVLIPHAPNINEEETQRLQEWFKEHGINDAVIVMTDTFEINEVPQGGK